MRKLWETPNMDLIVFDVDDVITSSSGGGLSITDTNTTEGNMTLDDFLNGRF